MHKRTPPNISGIYAALPTPFDSDGRPCLEILTPLVDFLLAEGMEGFCLGGATGEYAAIGIEERISLFQSLAGYIHGRAQLIMGTGGEHCAQVRRLALAAADSGAIAALLPTAGFLPYQQDDLVDFIGQVSAEMPLPVILYHIPQCTRDLGIHHILDLIGTIPNIIGLKDSSGQKENLPLIEAALAQVPMVFLMGSDDLLLEAFARGAVGAISGIASACPELILPVYRNWREGNLQAAKARQGILDEFIAHIRDIPSPWVVKLALQVRGFEIGNLAWPMGSRLHGEAKRFQDWFSSWLENGETAWARAPLKASPHRP